MIQGNKAIDYTGSRAHKSIHCHNRTEHIAIFTDKIIHNFAAAICFYFIKIRATQSYNMSHL